MRIGEEKEYNKEQELLNWAGNYGSGISGITAPQDLPKDCYAFCIEQYRRFGIPVPPEDVIFKGMWATFVTIDYMDPYEFFWGNSDVEITDEWRSRAYKINGEDLEPEFLETFKLMPNHDEIIFNNLMARPGLKEVNCELMIEDCIDGDYASDHVTISEQSWEWLAANSPALPVVPELPDRMSRKDYIREFKLFKAGHFDTNNIDDIARINDINEVLKDPVCAEFIALAIKFEQCVEARKDYVRLAAWATYAWIMGPLGRNFRKTNYEIFDTCYEFGECIIYSGNVYDPKKYTVESRAPQSCEICGLDSYCVELAYFNGGAKFICEHHLNGELPKFTPTSCGSRSCKYVECRFNPMHGRADAKQVAYKSSGQLAKKVKEVAPAITNKTQQALMIN